MTLGKFIIHIKSLSKIAKEYDDPVLINWVNELEQSIWTNQLQELASATIATSNGIGTYNLPTSVLFEDIVKVYELKDGNRYFQYSLCGLDEFRNHGYYKVTNKIGIYPVPTAAGNLEVIYRIKPTLKVDSTDILALPDAFTDIYANYILYNIHLIQQEIDISNNYLLQYNTRIKAVGDWWLKTR